MTRQEKSTLPRVAAKAKGSFIDYVDKFMASVVKEFLYYDNLHTSVSSVVEF